MEGERRLPVRGVDGTPPEPKRRKVQDASICVNCESRGTNCVSQEFADEQASAPDRRVTQRLGRVEEMLEKLVEKIMPDSYTSSRARPTNASPASAAVIDPEPVSLECPFSVGKPPMFEVLAPLRNNGQASAIPCSSGDLPTPAPSHHEPSPLSPKYLQVSKTLHELLPCQQDIDTIAATSPASSFVISFFSRYRDIAAGKTEDVSSIRVVPPPNSHPAVLAKRLMQLTNCLQQIQPTTPLKLAATESPRCLMAKFVSVVSELVAYNDDLVGYAEGLETLILISLYHGNAGNLRKSWLMLRRAIAVAQLMGVDRWSDKPLKSADPTSNPLTIIKAKAVWFRVNFTDRYLSLLLGLPAGTDDNSFLIDDPDDEPTDRLEKQHTVVMGAIIKRNSSKGDPSFGMTQAIDCDLEAAARSMASDFWQLPPIEVARDSGFAERIRTMTQLMLQMNHHNLLILLHLPFMLRDPKERRWDYSKATCVSSSRQLLRTFLIFRKLNKASNACRHTDYGALTASMTLLLGYLDPKLQARDQSTTLKREADRALIQEARDKLQQMADRNGDKLARDAACIIGRLLPLLNPDLMASGGQGGANESVGEVPAIHLEIPYLGTININPSAHTQTSQYDVQPHSHATPASSINTNSGTTSKTTSPNIPPNQHDYVNFPILHTPTHMTQQAATDWSTPSDQQHPEGYQGAEASHSLSIPMDYSHHSNEYPDFHGFAPTMQFEWSQAQLAHPELAAEADEWTFQGFDTTYFESLFSSGAQGL
ncbi:hypothetical protein ONZ43_g346 [Nemania bipapillata]|uniref:Uncharacterized protein n=1 Tax=Nemania bipapillata TaxID=110536 RepID=A0ACC2J8P6_9PEZI|nr:hypothetical protein ONZ43_g346 [Nemania bipapillata]